MEVFISAFPIGEASIHADGPSAAPSCARSAFSHAALDGFNHGRAHNGVVVEIDDIARIGADDMRYVTVARTGFFEG